MNVFSDAALSRSPVNQHIRAGDAVKLFSGLVSVDALLGCMHSATLERRKIVHYRLSQQAPVDRENCSRDMPCRRGCEKSDGRSDVSRRGEAPERREAFV